MTDRAGAAYQMRIAPLVPGIPGLAWAEARYAAVDLAQHGRPVLPGTYRSPSTGLGGGNPGAAGLESAALCGNWPRRPNPDVAMEWWTQRPYSVLPACGARVNGVEIPAPHEQRALAQSRRRGGHDDGLDHDPTLGNNRAGVPARRRVAEALQDGTGRSERCSCPWQRAARHPGDASRPQHLFSLVAEVEP